MNPRVVAACDLMVPEVREYAGLHDYDGLIQDLSPAGVDSGLKRVGAGPRLSDHHDEAHLTAVEAGLRTAFGTLQLHRSNPLVHIANLDVSCYDREYAPAPDRDEARRRHLKRWPDAVDGAIEALDRVPALVAQGLLGAARGLSAGVEDPEALAAHTRFVAHLESAASKGDPDAALGAAALASLMGDPEGTAVDLGRLARDADSERDRLTSLLTHEIERLAPGRPAREVVAELGRDHPEPDGIYTEATALIGEITAFTVEKDLLGDPEGTCLVGPAPPSRSWAMAMMSWAAPHEPDAASWYYVTPPDPAWPAEEREEWLSVFSRTSLPAITVHEVTPGHYAHGRALRRLRSDVRTRFFSMAFAEGWAHHVEELFVEEGFRADDPRFAIGVYLEALIRVTRLAAALGLHTGGLTLEECTRRFEQDAFLAPAAARSEANRATFDPTYGRYTWGKLEIRRLRDDAMAQWGKRYKHRRFHDALLALGSPPLGIMDAALA